MEPMSRPQAIIDFCLAPLNLDTGTEAEREVRRRLEHVIKTFQARAAQSHGRFVQADLARRGQAVHDRHLHVHQDDVVVAVAHRLHGLGAVLD